MFVQNPYHIHTAAFNNILHRESQLRELTSRAEKGSRWWNSLWDQLDGVLAAKHKYEDKVIQSRIQKGQDIYGY